MNKFMLLIVLATSNSSKTYAVPLDDLKYVSNKFLAPLNLPVVECNGITGPALCANLNGTFDEKGLKESFAKSDDLIFALEDEKSMVSFFKNENGSSQIFMISFERKLDTTKFFIEYIDRFYEQVIEEGAAQDYVNELVNFKPQYINTSGEANCSAFKNTASVKYLKIKKCLYSINNGIVGAILETQSGIKVHAYSK